VTHSQRRDFVIYATLLLIARLGLLLQGLWQAGRLTLLLPKGGVLDVRHQPGSAAIACQSLAVKPFVLQRAASKV